MTDTTKFFQNEPVFLKILYAIGSVCLMIFLIQMFIFQSSNKYVQAIGFITMFIFTSRMAFKNFKKAKK